MNKLDGQSFKQMILQAAIHLSNHKEKIDALNVFPVPDGDTGTNMDLTFSSGANEVKKSESTDIDKMSSLLSRGLLMGARGNSGVILSQLFRGFSKATEAKASLTAKEFATALERGVETAYKAVMKPIEGTILTVAKEAANKAVAMAESTTDITVVMAETLNEAKSSLNRTPNLLPVLKEVGVVDSGGQGLVVIYEAFLATLKGETLEQVETIELSMEEMVRAEHHKVIQAFISPEDIEYGYCTEFMIKLGTNSSPSFQEDEYREELESYGDSLLVVSDDDLVKVHIHSEKPGDLLTQAQTYGELINIKIENMRDQHSNLVGKDYRETSEEVESTVRPYGIVTVAAGLGIVELFQNLGATEVIHGGQTMNPSTEDLVQAIDKIRAETVFILPNNSNILMAAEQAAAVSTNEVIVIPTKTVPQGMATLFAFNQENDRSTNEEVMKAALDEIKSGQVTYAVRDTMMNGVQIKKDDFLSISEGEIIANSKTSREALNELLSNMVTEEDEIATLIYGEAIDEAEIDEVQQEFSEKFSHMDLEIHNGKQPVYSYIVAVE